MTRGIVVLLLICPGCDFLLGLKNLPPADAAPSEPIVYRDAAPSGPCSKMTMLADDFDNDNLDLMWPFYTAGVSESAGQVNIDLTPGTSALMNSVRYYDLRDSSFSIELTIGPGFTSSDIVSLTLRSARQNYALLMTLSNLQLTAYRVESGVNLSLGSTLYNPNVHKYWRISNAADVTYFATSADGMTYTTLASFPGLDYVGFMSPVIGVASSAETFETTLDNLNHGAPTSPACKSSTVTDDFESGSFGDRWARSNVNNGSVSTHDGIAELHMNTTGAASQNFLVPTIPIDLTGDAFVIEVPQLDAATNSGQNFEMKVVTFTGNTAEFAVTRGSPTYLVAQLETTGSPIVVGQPTYDAVAQRWLRIRESGNLVYWESSPDGKMFDLVGSNMVPGLDRAELTVELGGVTSAPSSSAIVDNWNLPPPP